MSGQYQPQLPLPNPLSAHKKISGIWPEKPPIDHLHVFISLPIDQSPAKRPRLDDNDGIEGQAKRSKGEGESMLQCRSSSSLFFSLEDEEDHLPWLKELRSKIWGGVKPSLIRTVTVTEADYDALQKRLNGLSDDKSIELAKLNFLQSLSTTSASPNLNLDDESSEEEVENDDLKETVIHKLFPSVFRYLDLTSLGLKNGVTNRFPVPMLYRQEYEDMTNLIGGESRRSKGSAIVTGQPGTGEFLVSLFHRI